mmetsp:Transcript_23485/g.69197  ORF Transcript_23485/g.69197 Transcript_23485/m.69197 type:complete len:224 (-) Transcript_23485:516-1187(-)
MALTKRTVIGVLAVIGIVAVAIASSVAIIGSRTTGKKTPALIRVALRPLKARVVNAMRKQGKTMEKSDQPSPDDSEHEEFHELDTDADGKISISELAADAPEGLLTEDQIAHLFAIADKDGDGTLSFEEYDSAEDQPEFNDVMMSIIMSKYDTDGDGALTYATIPSEFGGFMEAVAGESDDLDMGHMQVVAIMFGAMVDCNQDEVIDAHELGAINEDGDPCSA